MRQRILIWKHGKPNIHFSNSIVEVKDGYKDQIKYGAIGDASDFYSGFYNYQFGTEEILSYSDKNLLKIPPYFLCQDPLVIFEKNVARLDLQIHLQEILRVMVQI